MKKVTTPSRMRSTALVLGLLTSSLVCLCCGALVAVSLAGVPRVLIAVVGFFGYLFFFAHALQELSLPRVLIDGGPAPDGEVRNAPAFQRARVSAGPNPVFRCAA